MKRTPVARAFLVLVSAALPMPAQFAIGDAAVVGASSSQVHIVHLGTTTSFTLGNLGGSNSPTGVALDPNGALSLLVYGAGFLGSVRITGPGTATYSLLTTAIGSPGGLAWDGASFIAPDLASQQIVRIHAGTGAVTLLTSGPQPWGASLRCATVDTATGRIFVGGQLGVWMLEAGSSVAVPYASGWSSSPSLATGIAMDASTGDPVVILSGVDRVVRIAPGGTLIDLVTSGPAIDGPACIDVDDNGDFVVGGSGGVLKRVPRAGGAAVTLGSVAGLGVPSGVAAVRWLYRVTLTPTGGGSAVLGISGLPVGTIDGSVVPSLDVSLPVGAGPIFGLSPDALTLWVVSTFTVPAPGLFFRWTGTFTPSQFPAVPVVFPPALFPPGSSVDVVAFALTNVGLAVTPVHRARF